MQASMFNVRVPIERGEDVFLMNTFTDAQLIVSRDVVDLLDRVHGADEFSDLERETIEQLTEQGFVVRDRAAERDDLKAFFREVREGTDTLKITVLTTLQCNFACDYCIQGDHGDYNKSAAKMSMEMAARVSGWVEGRMDAIAPRRLVLTFFGGEPLLNMPVLYYMAERLHAACAARGVEILINIITNGLLLSREMVERLNPLGLNGIKITLDGDREAHNQSRPLRGGQGTFDRIIANTRAVADLTRIAVGGNFEVDTVDSYPALLDFLAEQDFAPKLSKVTFKPVIREKKAQAQGHDSADGRRRRQQAAERRVHDVGRHGRQPRLRLMQLRRRQDVVSSARRRRSAASRPRTACTWARARSTKGTPTPSVRTARCSPVPVSPARRCSRPAISTGAPRNSAPRRCAISRSSHRGRCATTARSFRSAPAAARSRRTTSWATCSRPNCHKPSFEAGLMALAREAALSAAVGAQ